MFVHDALCEVIQCGDTEISASKLGSAVETMAQSLPGKVVTGFEEQFQVSTLFINRSTASQYHDYCISHRYWTRSVVSQWREI